MSPLVDEETLNTDDQQLAVPTFSPMADAVAPPTPEPVTAEPVAPIGAQPETPVAPPEGADHPAYPAASQTPGIYVRSTSYAKSGRDKQGSDPDTDAGRTSTGGPLLEASDKVAGTAAVDPRVIPYGSIIRAADGRVYVAGDTGGAVKSMAASGGKAPVIDLYNGENHPDYQHVQIYAPAADYLKLTPEQKLAYHQQAAETFNGLPAGVQLASGPGQANPSALTPENIQNQIAASANAPGGLEAANRRGPLSNVIPAKGQTYSDDSDRIVVRGRYDSDTGTFTPNSVLPENQRGNDENSIPAYITKTMPDGSRQTFHSDEYGQAKGPPIKSIPAAQIPVADLLKNNGLPEAMAGDVLAKVANSGGTGARGRSVADIVSAMKASVAAGKSPAEALEAIKMPDPKMLEKVSQDFKSNKAVQQIDTGVIKAYEEIQRIAAVPMAQRTAVDDKILVDALQTLSTPNRAGTVSDQREISKGTSSLQGTIAHLKNFFTGGSNSGITDDQVKAAKTAADRLYAGVTNEYSAKYDDAKKTIEHLGGDPQFFLGPNKLTQLQEMRQQAAAKEGAGTPAAAPAAAPAPGKVPPAITTPNNVYIPPTAMGGDGMVKMLGSDGVAYRIPIANVDKAVAKGFKVAP